MEMARAQLAPLKEMHYIGTPKVLGEGDQGKLGGQEKRK
jgi:hypothetical protein